MGETPTFEQIMALFAEGRKETAELRKSMAEEDAKLRKSMAEGFAESKKETAEFRKSMAEETDKLRKSMAEETDKLRKSMAEEAAKLSASIARLEDITGKTNARLDANNARLDEAIAEMKINNHNMGLMTNKLGDMVESIVLPDIVDKFNEKGFKFDSVSAGVEFLNEKKDGNLAEVDALLENGKFVIAVETKTELKQKDVNDHIKRLNTLRGLPRFKGKKIYGALATAIAKKRPVNYALGKGFYVLQQPDVMGVKILDFPKGHSAKAW
jgi:hypothetical protein